MGWADVQVNVGLWNLSAILGAVAGCGALIPAGDGETDTDGDPDDDDGPIVDTELPSPTTGTQDTDACDCPPGEYCDGYGDCIGNEECRGEGYIGPAGECCYGPDYDCYCDFAEDCSAGQFCAPIDDTRESRCGSAVELLRCDPDVGARVIPLPDEASGAIALAFAEVEPGGGLELLVVQPGEARLVTAAGASVTSPVALATADTDASTAAVDHGRGMGFAVSAPGSAGAQLVTFVEGTLVAGPLEGSGLGRIVAGDFDGDGIDDIAGLEGEALVWRRGTGIGFTEGSALALEATAPFIAGPFDGDGADDIAFHSGSGDAGFIHAIARGGELQTLPDRPAMIQSLGTADFDGDGLADIIGISGWESTMVAFPWANADAGQFEPGMPRSMPDIAPGADLRYRLASGDFDGDGRQDVVIGSNSLIRILFGSGDMDFRCHADVIIQHRATFIAVGDLEGDGRDDIAFSDGETTTVLAHE